ncbi:MAG: hypothetical protein WKF56_00935 [Candidatus Limnocylindrales bacterium]
MPLPGRPLRSPFRVVFLVVVLAACGSAPSRTSSTVSQPGTSPGSRQTSRPISTPTNDPSSGPTAGPQASPGVATSRVVSASQTETEWGRIWDALPAGFPVYPGSTPADDAGPEPLSGRFAIEGGDPAEIAAWTQAALETATYSTEALSGPFEDGGFVLDSVGQDGCRIEVGLTPQGGLTFIDVHYGAACPDP